jgi:serine/threonine-protein kinase ATR
LLIAPQVINKDYYGPGKAEYDKLRKDATFKNLSVQQMIVSYIKKLKDAALKQIKERVKMRDMFKKTRVKYILTVPCFWSEVTRYSMRIAAVLAGLATSENDFTIITEPEAVVLSYDGKVEEPSDSTSPFIVCDAGGNTVNLITYDVGIQDEDQRTFIEQIGEGCGDFCGSNRLNRLFPEYLRNCFPEDFPKKQEFFKFIIDSFEKEKVQI